jgi:hypothetical protein
MLEPSGEADQQERGTSDWLTDGQANVPSDPHAAW